MTVNSGVQLRFRGRLYQQGVSQDGQLKRVRALRRELAEIEQGAIDPWTKPY